MTYGCDAGYKLNGSATATCQANGMFTGPAPTCEATSCGTFTDVIYQTTGTFAIGGTTFGIGNQTFTGLTSNAATPKFAGAGDTTPFTPTPFTNGFARLRYTNNAAGTPVPGIVYLVEWYFPLDFNQTAGANLTADVSHSVGLLAAGLDNCGGGNAACTNHAPTLQRDCASNAQGTLAGTTITWSACTPAPNGGNSWSFVDARAAAGAGCAENYNAWGNVTCNSGCGVVPAAGLGDSYQTWNQQLGTITLSSANIATATFTMKAMQIPNGTGASTTTLSITSSTVVSTQCGSTPGTDLKCDVE